MKQIITDITDVDFYKITMLYVIFKNYPNVETKWSFYNRGNHKFPYGFGDELRKQIDNFKELKFDREKLDHIRKIARAFDGTPLFDESFYTFLKGYEYNPNDVKIKQEGENLYVDVEGLWSHTMFYETQIMATIVELYNLMNGKKYEDFDEEELNSRDRIKFNEMRKLGVKVAEFGMRRRAFKENQNRVVKLAIEEYSDVFVGTSNVMFSRKYNCKSIGSKAHEINMVLATKYGPVQSYEESMEKWSNTFRGSLGTELPDCYGTKVFLSKFDMYYTRLFDGVRQDSGNPIEFTDWMIEHYKSKGVDPKSKTIIYSDSINSIDKIKKYNNHRKNEIKKSYGIGTWLVNDLPNIKSMNIVVKVSEAKFDEFTGWKHCVKIGDDSGKYTYKDKKTLDNYLNVLNIK